MRIVADIGSTHGNRLDYLYEAVDFCKEYNIFLKCQLFEPEHPAAATNLSMNKQVYLDAQTYATANGVTMLASVFDKPSYDFLKDITVNGIIKFAYSMRHDELVKQALKDHWKEIIISYDWMDDIRVSGNITTLLCVPRYPVLETLNISRQWFDIFDGFSDHTLGIDQSARALQCGCQTLEKHVRFPGYSSCPDSNFAIDADDLILLTRIT